MKLFARIPKGAIAPSVVIASAMAATLLIGVTTSAFSGATSNKGNTFSTATSFGGSCPAAPTPVWFTGMEHGSTNTPYVFSSGGIGGGIMDTAVKHNGTRSLRIQKGVDSQAYMRKALSGQTQVVHLALQLAALPSGDVTVAVLDSSIGTDLRLKYNAATQSLALQWGDETPVAATSTFAAGTWYTLDIKATTAASPLTADWRVDGVAQSPATSAAAATSHGGLLFGSNVSEAPGYTAYYDDVFYSKTLGDYPIGDVRILGLHPSGVSTHSGPENFRNDDDTPIDPTSWTRIDDPTMFGGTDHLKQVTPNTSSYLEFPLEDTTESCIAGVQGYATMGSLGSRGGSQGGNLKSTIFDGPTERVIYSGGSPCGNCTQPMNALIPPTGGQWTQSALNGLLLRIGYGDSPDPIPYWGGATVGDAVR